MSRTAATGHSGSSADLPSRPDRPRQEIGLHKQNQTPTFPAGFPRRFFLLPQCLQGGRTCRAGEVVGRPMVAPTFIAGTAIKFVGAGIAARLSQSSPHLVGADALMPSEEGCSIPFPPGRRKLHIRSLLLPSQIVTVSLGHNLAIWNFTTPHAILMMALRQHLRIRFVRAAYLIYAKKRRQKASLFCLH